MSRLTATIKVLGRLSAKMTPQVFYHGNDMLVVVNELKNSSSGAYTSSATVTAELKKLDGTSLEGANTLAYVSETNGKYQGIISDAASTSGLRNGRLVVIADDGAGIRGVWDFMVHFKTRADEDVD